MELGGQVNNADILKDFAIKEEVSCLVIHLIAVSSVIYR